MKRFILLVTLMYSFSLPLLVADVNVKLGSILPIDSVWDQYLNEMSEEWETLTNGEVKLTIYSGGIQGDESEQIRKMQIGQLDGAVLSPLGMNEIEAETFVFAMPFLFHNDEEVNYVLNEIKPYFDDKLTKKGFIILDWVQSGWINLFSKEKIVLPEDLQTKKLFFSESASDVAVGWGSLGVEVVSVSSTEMLSFGQNGSVDLFALPASMGAAFQIYRVTNYLNTIKTAPLVGAFILTQRTWRRIPAKYHQALRDSIARLKADFLKEIYNVDAELLNVMVDLGGIQVVEPTEEQTKIWYEKAYTPEPLVGDGKLISQELFDSVVKAQNKYNSLN